ncbi:MAG: TRAP transporter small permease [Proteobacteria bacterium]|nr:TRAP transporter small permease [Pseudomonadota bacterium]
MLAIAGGVFLTIIAMMTTVSIVGRKFFDAPIPGDFELVAIGSGICVFAFLPWCQMVRGNVLVDFFMSKAPVRAKTFFDTVGALIYLAIASVITWRMIEGGFDMYNVSERSMTINFPRWTTFPISILFLFLLLAVTVYTIHRSIAETREGRYFDEDAAGH